MKAARERDEEARVRLERRLAHVTGLPATLLPARPSGDAERVSIESEAFAVLLTLAEAGREARERVL